MATRKNTFLVRRSNVAGNVPTAGQLLLGELALNTADVILYTSGTTANSILPIGWDRISRTGDTMTGSFSAPTISATTYYNLPNDLPSGGTTGQILAKIDATNYNTEWIDNYTSQLKHVVSAGEVINKGQAVYVSSANGTNMIVSKASNTSEATSSKTLGLLAQTLSINGQGFVITEGLLAGLNTLGANAGDPVWLGINGDLIYGLPNKPYAPTHLVFIGVVTRVNSNNGEIFVKVQNGFELNEIHDVDLKTTTPIDGHILGYNGTLWVNKTIAGWLGFTPANDANVLHTTGNESASGIKTFSDTTQSTSISSGAVVVGGGMGVSKNLYVGGNLNLGGNLNIGGTLTTINAQNLSVSDNMIYLNNGIQTTITNAVGDGSTVIYTTQETHNYLSGMTVSISGINPTAYNLTNQTIISVSTNSFTISNSASGLYVSGGIARAKTSVNPDLGFAGGYNDGSYAHAGLFRDATDGVWKFFKGYTPEPDASPFIDTSDPTFAYADLRAFNITSNSFIKVGGTSGQFLKADGSIDSTLYTPTSRTLTINSTSYDLSANRSWDIPIVTANTFNNGTYDLTISTSNGLNYTSNLGLLATDVKVTGGTYNINTGIVTFTNSSGGTFNVTGFSSGMTDTFVTGGTYSNGTATFTRSNNQSFNVTGFNTGTVTNVAALTLGTSGTDLSSTVANGTTTPVITLNVPTASATNRGVLSSANWTTFNNKQPQLNGTGFVKANGTTISYDNTNYLPLIGGTLTGALYGTVGSFSQSTGGDTLTGYHGGTGGNGINGGAGNGIGGYFVNNSTTYPTIKLLGLSPTRLIEGRSTSDVITFAVTSAGAVSGSSFIRTGGTSVQFLKADGTVDSNPYTTNLGTVTSVNAGNGMNFSNFTTSGTITLGTPSNTTLSSTNAVTTNSHTHAFSPGGTTSQYITGAGTLVTFPTLVNTFVTGTTFNNGTYDLTITRNDGVTITSNLGLLATDVKVTGGTYNINTGTVTFTNSTGGTFNVTGFSSGMTDTYTTGGTYSNGTATFTRTNGGTYDVTGFKTTDTYWTSGSSGSYSIKAVNSSGLDAVGAYAVAEGYATLASGSSSHAEGYLSKAGGNYSHAEGYETVATGIVSHAQGYRVIASGYGSHGEGQYNTASGELSHAEGSFNNATGQYSHVGGSYSQSNGVSSFVHGNSSTANGNSTIVLGSNIVGDNSNTTYVENLIVSGDVQTQFNIVGDGNVITFTNPNYGNTYETIDTGIAITRANNNGPYNPYSQSSWSGVITGTKWNGEGWGNLDNLLNRNFIDDFQMAVGGSLGNYIVGKELIMYDTINNKYHKIKFTQWTQGGAGGGFSYDRELINTTIGTVSSSKFIVQGAKVNQYSKANGTVQDFINLSPSSISQTAVMIDSTASGIGVQITGKDYQGISVSTINGTGIYTNSANNVGVDANGGSYGVYANSNYMGVYAGGATYGIQASSYGANSFPIVGNGPSGQIFTLKGNGTLLLNTTSDNTFDKLQVNGSVFSSGYKKNGSNDTYLLLGGGGHTLASNYVPSSRTITINGTSYDLSANRSWTITGGVSGSGTSGYIPRFTSATAIGDGRMQDDGAGLVTLTSNSSSNAMFILDASTNNSALLSHKMNGSMYYLTGMDSSQNYRFNVYNAGSFVNCAIYIPKATTRVVINGTTDDGSSQFQVNGTAKVTSSLTANSFVKIGGTSAQFLKADGSVDSNTYATTGSLSSYVPTSRTITINGTSYDLSTNRSWTVSATETDTLATVTSRGNTTNTLSYFTGGLGVDAGQLKFNQNGVRSWNVQASNGSLNFTSGDGVGNYNFDYGVNVNGELAVKNASINNQQNTSFGVGTTTVFTKTLGSITAAFFDYVGTSGSNARAGSIMVVVNGSSVEFTETSTNDIGSTTALTLTPVLSGGNLILNATSTSGTWSLKVLARLL